MYNKLLISLIKSFRKGDINAFTVIYDEFEDLIRFYGRKISGDDASQELTLFLLELLYAIPLRSFLEDCSDGLRRYKAVSIRNKYIALSIEHQKSFKLWTGIYDDDIYSYDSTDIRLEIQEALQSLPSKQRLIIIYRYVYGYSIWEIGKILGISRQAVNCLKIRALASLKNYLN